MSGGQWPANDTPSRTTGSARGPRSRVATMIVVALSWITEGVDLLVLALRAGLLAAALTPARDAAPSVPFRDPHTLPWVTLVTQARGHHPHDQKECEMTDQNWDAGAVSDHGADAGAEHGAPGPLKPGDGGADHGADGGSDHGADKGADHGADGGSDHGAEHDDADGGADAGADAGADGGADGGAGSTAEQIIEVHDSGADRGADGVAGELKFGSH